jgi:hypothetical protein
MQVYEFTLIIPLQVNTENQPDDENGVYIEYLHPDP